MGFSSSRKVLLLYLIFAAAVVLTCLSVASALSEPQLPQRHRRLLLLLEDTDIQEEDEEAPIKKKSTISSFSKNKTKSLKPTSNESTDSKPLKSNSTSNKNQTKLIKPISSSLKNKTKDLLGSKGEGDGYTLEKNKLNKLNSTSKIKAIKSVTDLSSSKSEGKKVNSTSKALPSSSSKKSSDLLKSTSSTKIKSSKSSTDEKIEPKKISSSNSDQNKKQKQQNSKAISPPTWLYNSDEDDDLVSEFRDLPTKFQKTFIPDLRRISSSSQIYLSKANKEMTKGFKPYVGNKYAPSIATTISCAFIIIPFLLVSLLFNRIKAYFSLQKLLIFIQVYLSIYFTILCLSSLVTGLEPLKFFYATSQSTYVWLQVLQTLGYVLYLLLLLMYLVLVFSTDCGLGSKFLGLAQTFVGFAVGLHYYMTVFHRVVLRQPPKTSWKVHAVYATCFLVICLLAGADRRKKAYRGEGGEEGKKS